MCVGLRQPMMQRGDCSKSCLDPFIGRDKKTEVLCWVGLPDKQAVTAMVLFKNDMSALSRHSVICDNAMFEAFAGSQVFKTISSLFQNHD